MRASAAALAASIFLASVAGAETYRAYDIELYRSTQPSTAEPWVWLAKTGGDVAAYGKAKGKTSATAAAKDAIDIVLDETHVGVGDDLGDHTATTNILLNGEWLSGDGGDEGVFVDSAGNVGIGTSTPQSKEDVEGGLAVGATYSGTTAAPTNGVIVEGRAGFGSNAPETNVHISESNLNTKPALEIEQLSTGDAAFQLSIAGDAWAFGIDNSDSDDSLKLCYAAAAGTAILGTGCFLDIAPNGQVGFGAAGTFRLEAKGTLGGGYFGLTNSTSGDVFKVDGSGQVSIGTITASANLDVDQGTGRGIIEIDGSTGGCLKIRDTDDAGFTYCTALNGVLSCSTSAC